MSTPLNFLRYILLIALYKKIYHLMVKKCPIPPPFCHFPTTPTMMPYYIFCCHTILSTQFLVAQFLHVIFSQEEETGILKKTMAPAHVLSAPLDNSIRHLSIMPIVAFRPSGLIFLKFL